MRNLALSVALIAGLFLPIGAIRAQSTETVTATCKDGTSFTGTKRSGACRGHVHQATDRAHRIGQTKPVFVYKLIAADTVEERIIELQDKKGRLAAATLDAGAAVGSFAAEDLDYLFSH